MDSGLEEEGQKLNSLGKKLLSELADWEERALVVREGRRDRQQKKKKCFY